METSEPHGLVARRTPSTPAADALYGLVIFQLGFGDAADAGGAEVCFFGLYAAEAAELFIALLLPLCYQIRVGIVVLQEPVVKGFAYGFFLIVKVVYVSRPLMGNLENRPQHLILLLPFVGGVLGIFHLVCKLEEGVLYIFEAIRWRLLVPCSGTVDRHGGGLG